MPTPSGSGGTARAARRPTTSTLPLPQQTGGVPAPIKNPDSKIQGQAKRMLMDAVQLSQLQNNLRIANLYISSRHLEMLTQSGTGKCISAACPFNSSRSNRAGITIYQITKLMYNEEENSFEKLASLYSALNSFGGVVALVLQSDGMTTNLFLCTNTSGSGHVAGELLSNNIRGQFPGCEVEELEGSRKNGLLDSFGKTYGSKNRVIRSLSMIPSRREDERQHDKEFSAQGYEKFVDAMKGNSYTLIVLSQRISPDAMEECLDGLETMYTLFSPYAKETASYSESESDTVNFAISSNINTSMSRSISKSFGTSHTDSISSGRSTNKGSSYELFGGHFNSGSGTSYGTSTATGSSSGTSTGSSTSEAYGSGESQSSGATTGSNHTLSVNRDNKAVQNLLMKIEEHIKRINQSQTFGMWNSACYVLTEKVSTATIATSTLAALFSGDSQAVPRAYYNQWDDTNPKERDIILDYLQNLEHPIVELTMLQQATDANGVTKSIPGQPQKITPAIMISGKEIPTLMGFPRKSIPGIVVDRMAEFGRNVPEKWRKHVSRPVMFGNVFHMGQEENTMTVLDLDAFASHTFICGASGSGKSNTTFNLLQKLIENKVPFLVIEPAKGEYKVEFAGLPGVNIFTAEESPFRMLQINPFEFSTGIHVREHLDSIVQAISACWPLYGAMPGLLKQAFEQVYIDHGWDLEHSERIINRGSKFPVFSDLAKALERIINDSPYSAQTKGDYKGALLYRVSSLCNGFEGQIFGRSLGIPDATLFGKNTIIDLSSIGSDETRSLIMGILIIKLKNYRKVMSALPNSSLTHVTVLEEAHNLLKRCSQEIGTESSNVQGMAVASLCRCIAEMRSAGEGFMIIDQSPGAVDPAAIKNTAIKIVMRLPSKDDCEEIGAALSLDERQTRELSRLDIGIAAIFHAGWTDTILAKMGTIWDKRYRIKARPLLDKGTYTKIQGAVLQLMYQDMKDDSFLSIYDDVADLLELLCTGSTALHPLLPDTKHQEILDQVYVFVENNGELIRQKKKKPLLKAFGGFVYDFLRLDSVMRIFPLRDVNPSLTMDPLTPKETRTVLAWEREVRLAVLRYLFMPEKCNPKRGYVWPTNAENSQFFKEIYCELLDWFASNKATDFRYRNALDCLKSNGYFRPAATTRR